MSRLRVAPIVEGHGEVKAVRLLLQNAWRYLGGDYVEVLEPHRVNRGQILNRDGLERAVTLAGRRLRDQHFDVERLILLLIDAEDDCQKSEQPLGPALLKRMEQEVSDIRCAAVLANPMFETWFAGSAETMAPFPDPGHRTAPGKPEDARIKKEWVQVRMPDRRYSETVDQPKLAHRIDPSLCSDRCPSFAKLMRELRKSLPG